MGSGFDHLARRRRRLDGGRAHGGGAGGLGDRGRDGALDALRAGRRVERRIGDIYELIRAKAEAARNADYVHPPLEAFALYHALREELFELALAAGRCRR